MTHSNFISRDQIERGIEDKFGHAGFKQEFIAKRNEYASEAAKSEFCYQLAEEYGEANFWGFISRMFGREEILKDVAACHYNKGFRQATNIDLYDHNVGNEAWEKTAEKRLFNALFKTNMVICSAIYGFAALAGGIVGAALWSPSALAIAAGGFLGITLILIATNIIFRSFRRKKSN